MDNRYSVIIPALNSAAYIGAAIGSVLRQSLSPHRVIVIDDGSTDETAAVVGGFGERVEALTQDNAGPGAATTRGMMLVDTPFMAFIDADDLWMENKAALQLSRLQADHGLDGLFAHGVLSWTAQPPFSGLPTQPIWGRTSFMVRTERARSVGAMVDPPGRRGEMMDWINRARAMGLRFEMIADVLVVRRVHEGSLTYYRGSKDVGYLAVAKAALDRRRSGGRQD
jgi:glycosyltransferase involved in cell wall biosynthesis